MKCSEGSTGTIVELNLSSSVASVGLNPQDWNATPEPLMNFWDGHITIELKSGVNIDVDA